LNANEEEREEVYQSVERLIKQIRNRDRQRWSLNNWANSDGH
jgi:hypothetical protein